MKLIMKMKFDHIALFFEKICIFMILSNHIFLSNLLYILNKHFFRNKKDDLKNIRHRWRVKGKGH